TDLLGQDFSPDEKALQSRLEALSFSENIRILEMKKIGEKLQFRFEFPSNSRTHALSAFLGPKGEVLKAKLMMILADATSVSIDLISGSGSYAACKEPWALPTQAGVVVPLQAGQTLTVSRPDSLSVLVCDAVSTWTKQSEVALAMKKEIDLN